MKNEPISILVTGATGYLGANLCAALTDSSEKEGRRVYALVRTEPLAPQIQPYLEKTTPLLLNDNASNIEECFKEAQPSVVVHLASSVPSSQEPAGISSLMDGNITFGTKVLAAMSSIDCRSLVSTGSIHQHFNNQSASAQSLYGASKNAFNEIRRYYQSLYPLKHLALHMGTLYGPNDWQNKLITRLLKQCQDNSSPLHLTAGEQLLHLTHINDAVDGLKKAITQVTRQTVIDQRYNLRPKDPLTIKQLVAILEEITEQSLNIRWGDIPYQTKEWFEAWTEGQCIKINQKNLRDSLSELISYKKAPFLFGEEGF